MSGLRKINIPFLSSGITVIVLAISFWTVTAQGIEYMQPGGLLGAHGVKNIACPRCHRALAGVPDAKCIVCHKNVGRERAVHEGRHAGMIGSCYRCHIMHDATGAGTAVDEAGIDHNLVGFTLEKHEKQSCAACHDVGFKSAGGQINALCFQCHAAPEKTMGKDNPQASELSKRVSGFEEHRSGAGDNCINCHAGGNKVAYKHVSDLRGKHTQIDCNDCHRGGVYAGLSWTCSNCHKSPHKADIGEDCAKCHNQNKWSQTTMKHDLNQDCGKCHIAPPGHFSAACTECHKSTANWKSAFRHPRIPEHSPDEYPCNYCHPSGNADVDCRRCHNSKFPRDD